MKRCATLILLLLALFVNRSALAFSWTSGYYDFGTSPFDANNNTAPIFYPYGVGYLPTPGHLGEGGETFDLEGFFVAFDQDFMYLALTNSYGMTATSSSWRTSFNQGDIFLGYGDARDTYAIDVSSGDLVSVGSWRLIDDVAGSCYDDVAIRNRVGAFEVTQGTTLGTANQTLTFWEGLETDPLLPDGTGGDTYVFEWKIDRDVLGWNGASNIFFHTTLGCGNDLVEYSFSVIPEPATVILLGLGLFGAGILIRKK